MSNDPQLYVDENTLGLELGTSLDLARKAPVKPDDEAALREASKRLNIPLDSARTLPQQTKELAQQAAFDPNDYAKRFPNSAKFLANQDNARIAVDDVEPLSAVEAAVLNNKQHSARIADSLERGVGQIGVLGELTASGIDRALTYIGSRFLPEPRAGGEVSAINQTQQTNLASVAQGYSNMPRDMRMDVIAKVVDNAAAQGATFSGILDAVKYMSENPGAVVNFMGEMLPAAVLGGGVGGAAVKPLASAVTNRAVSGYLTAAAVSGAATATGAYPAEFASRLSENGGNVDEAMSYAQTKAGVEGGVNALFGGVGGALPIGSTLAGRVGNILGQTSAQAAGGVAGAAAASAAVGEEISAGELFLEGFLETVTAPSDIAIASVVQAQQNAEARRLAAERATMSAAGLEQLLTAAAQSQTRVRAPESFSQLVQQAAVQGGAITEVYFDAQPFVDALEQSGLAPEQIERLLPSVRDNLAEAVATNGTVMVPIGEMVTAFAGTGVEQALLQQARTEPDALSVADTAQAQALTEQLQQDAEQVLAQQEQRKAWDESAKQVYDTMLGQLNTAGRFSNDVNKAQATVVRDFFTVMASRLGTTPAELYQHYPLRATATLPGGQGDVLEQSDTQRALAMSEDDYIAAINPTGETNTEDGSARLVRGDLSDPVDAEVVRQLDGGVTIERDSEGNFYARQGGDTIGEIINYGDEVNVNVLPEARGKGVAVNLAAEFMRVNPFFNAGSLTPGGEAVVRAAHRMLKGEVLNQSVVRHPFAGFTREQFLGNPTITKEANASTLQPRVLTTVETAPVEPFAAGEGLTAKYSPDGAAVFDGDKVIASYNFGDTLVVDKKYRRQGIAAELVYQYRMRNPSAKPARERTKKSQALQEKVWDRIERELASGEVLNQSTQQTETEAFKRWFGDSKVVDGSGKPLVVYHGTARTFDAFEASRGNAYYFTDDQAAASVYAANGEEDEYGEEAGPNVVPVYLSLQNPVVLDAAWQQEHMDDDGDWNWEALDNALYEAEEAGHDGAVLRGFMDFAGHEEGNRVERQYDQYIAFRAEQIKSAIGNRGTFNPADPNILNQQNEARATFNPATLNIALLEKADLSSFLHELGHFYFEVLADIASQPNAPQQIVDDMNTLLRMAGFEGTATGWLQQPVNARRDAHEMVAESFEQYLFDGKAPSLEQQALFSRLRAWMVSVYRTIAQFLQTNKNAQLTDEVRGVFDRMLATDAQIEAARAARSFGPMFESAEQAGMTPEQFEQYKSGVQQETDDATRDLDARRLRDMRWLQNYRSKKLRELQKDAKAKRQAVLDEVTAEVDAQRTYQTLAFIRSGKLPDGTAKPEGMASTRLNRGIIESMYGEQFKVPDALLSRDGVDPEIVASLFGYASADQMVREVANAEPRKDLIAGMTDQRMLERYGDLASAEAIERAADAAIANDAHARMVSTELAAVTKQLGSVQAISRAARDFAERSTGSKAIKYLRPDQAAADAARQRKATEQALKKGDTAAAADAKRNELLAVELQRAQTKAKQEIVKARNDMRRLWGKDEQKAKTRDMNLVNAARAVVAQYGIAPERAGEAATAYIEKVAAYDAELAANLTAMMSQAPAAKPFKDLTVDEFRAVRDVVQSLYYMSKRSKQMEIDGKKVELDSVADELTNRLLDLSGGELPPLAGVESTATKWDHLKVGALGVRAMGTRVEQWADRLGPQFTQYIWNPVSEAVTRYRAKRNDMVGKYRDLLKQVAPGLTYRPIYAPELGAAGFTFNHGKVEILHALLHSGNPSNLRKLLLGRGWATVDEAGNLDTRNWDRFVARAINEGIITKADYDFAQGVWDLLETTKVDAQRAHLEMYGYYFNEVTAQPIQTPFGEYRGGYVPAVADPISAPDAAQKREMEDMNAVGNSFMFPTTGKGFTQARVEYNRPLMLDLRTLSSHIDKVARFSYIEPTIRDVANLLNAKKTPRFANALNRYDQGAIAKMLIPWLQRTAQQTTSLTGKDRYVDAFFRGLRSRSGMYLMFANVVNTLQQLTGFSVAALKVPAPMLLRAAYRYIQAPKRTAAEAAAISPWLAQRQSNQAFEMTQQINDILIDPNLYQKVDAFIKKHAYFMQTALQNVMDTVVWTGAYDNALAKGAEPKQAMRYADEAVRTTQGTFAPEDVSAMEVQTPFVQLFTQFWGYFNMLANTLGAESNKAIRDMGYMASTRRLAFIWFAGLALPAFVAELIASGAPDDEDDEDGDGVLDEWLAMFFGSQGRTLTAMVPVAGQVAQLVWNKLDDKWYNDKLNVSPALSLGDSAVSGVASILQGKAFDERLTKGEVREMATLIGLATGMPTNVAARPIGYALDVEAGKQDPEGAGDVVWGLTTGR